MGDTLPSNVEGEDIVSSVWKHTAAGKAAGTELRPVLKIMEQIHGVFASYLYNTYLAEHEKHTNCNLRNSKEYTTHLNTIVNEIISHEDAIIDYVFRNSDSINDITADDLKTFIRERVNFVMKELNYDIVYFDINSTIADWFYQGTKSIKLHDFFVAGTSQYRRNWSFDKLSVLPHTGATNAN